MKELLASTNADANWTQLRPVLDEVMHELSSRDRDAILMRFFEKRSFAEVGRHLGLGENAARMAVERALDKLGGLLAKRGITSTGSALTLMLANQAIVAAPVGLEATIASAALASAAGSVVPALSFFQLMSTTKTMVTLAVIGCLAVGTAIYFDRAADSAENRQGLERAQADRTLAQFRRLNAERAAVAASKPAEPSPAATSPANQAAEISPAQARAAANRELAADIGFNELLLQRGRAQIGKGRGRFYHELGLTADQIARFEAVLNTALNEARQVRRLIDTWNDPTRNRLLQAARERMESGIREVVGEKGLQKFLDDELAVRAEGYVAKVAGSVYFTDTPLTAEQGRQLARILAQYSSMARSGVNYFDEWSLEWDATLAEASTALTPKQLDVLRAEKLAVELNKKISALRRERQKANDAGGNSR